MRAALVRNWSSRRREMMPDVDGNRTRILIFLSFGRQVPENGSTELSHRWETIADDRYFGTADANDQGRKGARIENKAKSDFRQRLLGQYPNHANDQRPARRLLSTLNPEITASLTTKPPNPLQPVKQEDDASEPRIQGRRVAVTKTAVILHPGELLLAPEVFLTWMTLDSSLGVRGGGSSTIFAFSGALEGDSGRCRTQRRCRHTPSLIPGKAVNVKISLQELGWTSSLAMCKVHGGSKVHTMHWSF
ncbi:hypothetical protein HNY73_000794 [Argiope bruennichi]|uniref:Uncharacterized protein n=1 Tax=Argiope bruennichi TaxID=94029 RepID=A0A8T0FZ83_ARGBR|nr:hypothetical protein HNY73_000794 [Argiope bruennichi]